MRYLFGFALLLPMVVLAKDPPLAEALLNAKTAFVEKVSNAEEYYNTYCKTPKVDAGVTYQEQDKLCKSLEHDAKGEKLFFDKFRKALKKWGRFTLVQSRSSADIRILLSITWRNVNLGWPGMAYIYNRPPPIRSRVGEAIINIRDRRNDVLLYLDQTDGPGKLVSHLKKGMKQK